MYNANGEDVKDTVGSIHSMHNIMANIPDVLMFSQKKKNSFHVADSSCSRMSLSSVCEARNFLSFSL
jgi:hypothetical protein